MESIIPLPEGDLLQVFPDLPDAEAVAQRLDQARRTVEEMAARMGSAAGFTGCGLEFSGATLAGVVHGPNWDDAEFLAELRPAGTYADDDPATGWFTHATISIRCDADIDCGMHLVEELAESHATTPLEAANALRTATRWLSERASAEVRPYWREHDPESGHRKRWEP